MAQITLEKLVEHLQEVFGDIKPDLDHIYSSLLNYGLDEDEAHEWCFSVADKIHG